MPSPADVPALLTRADTLYADGQFAESLELLERVLAIEPGHPLARLNASSLYLMTGRFEEGWPMTAARWETLLRGRRLVLDSPEWDRQPLEGTLLAWGEQGLGDQILCLGMAGELAALATRVVLAVDHRLVALAARSFRDFRVVSLTHCRRERADASVPFGDLGGTLRLRWEDFPRERASYLVADPGMTQATRRVFAAKGKVVCGVAWLSRAPRTGAQKSIPLAALAPILRLPGIVGVNLQYGDTRDDHKALAAAGGGTLLQAAGVDRFADIDRLAAVVAACDIVITGSNVVAHLAGALGRPTCLLLPRALGRQWYWHTGAGRSPWYPTVRMFSQSRDGDWSGPAAAARRLVERRLAASGVRLSPPVRPSP